MSEERRAVKLDFTTGLEAIPPRPKMDAATTEASVVAGRQFGFSGRAPQSVLDGRRLRSRGANTQLNLKVTAEEKAKILLEASRHIQDPSSPVANIGEFVVQAIDYYTSQQSRRVHE